MDIGMERNEGGATIGTLFQHIVNDMKNSSPLWEDFIAKATKLHACLRAAIQALAVYLEAFQKIADAATNSKGATKEIGTALTRVCLRHKAVETRMKTFTAAIMDCLIVPLQEKLEDWKKQVAIIDKDHAKEYKRCRTELKKRSSDTLRLQKKAKKGQTDNLHILVESSMQDVTLRRSELEEVERKSLRSIMVEERSRYCTFVNMLQPVVHEECEVMSELSHLQEAMQIIAVVTKDPAVLPQASEELILESKTNMNLYPDSPGGSNSQGACSNSLGSRKSSVCSISSINSSSSGSPGHQFQRSLSQYSPAIRLKPGESSDSGFCSSPALTSQASTLASQSHAVSTWPPHTQDGASSADRPHTISSAYEKGHQRPALTVYTFQNPEAISENQKSPANISCRPPLPVRCSSLERPLSTASIKNSNSNVPRQCPSPIPAHITKVLEKTSMFEQQINNNQNAPTRSEPIYGRKGEDIYKTTGLLAEREAGPNRVARRASVNTVKPPPPVRRSSSVTPSPNLGTASPNLAQQSLAYTSSESLPPPPAYLLDSTTGNSLIPGNVAGTVKALNEIRHKPASPGVLRRAQQPLPNQQPPASSSSRNTKSSSHQHGIYAQPKQLTSMSSFRTASPGPQKQSTGFLAQLNARIAPNKPQTPASPQHYQQQQSFTYTTAPSNESAYHRSSPADQRTSYSSSHHQQSHQPAHGIYSSASQQASGHHQQQANYYQQQSHSPPVSQRDGKNQVYSSAHSQIPQAHHYQHQQQQQQQQTTTSQYYYQSQPQQNYAAQNIYVSTNPFATASPVHAGGVSSYSPSSFGKAPARDSSSSSANGSGVGVNNTHDNSGHGVPYNRSSSNRSNSASNANSNNVLAKTSAGFLENLNARLAEQRLSGKAFAVRNLINSKALFTPNKDEDHYHNYYQNV